MADSKISQLTSYTTPTAADVIPIVDTANTTTKKVAMSDFFNILSSLFTLKDSSDTTKKVAFILSGITTAVTRSWTFPDASSTFVGTDTNQSITNKTLSTGTKINTSGSDTTGSIYYRDSSGNLTPLAVGSSGQILSSSGTLPQWIANPSASDASYSTKGVVQGLTDAATSGLTITAGVISVNSGTSANQIVKLNGSGQLPAVSGALLTNLTNPAIYKNGTTTYDTSTASGTQTIAHGCGRTPIMIRLSAFCPGVSGNTAVATSHGVYNGTTNSCIYFTPDKTAVAPVITNSSTQAIVLRRYDNSGVTDTSAAGVVTVDATNITITWTKSGTQTGTAQILWEAYA